MSLELAFERCVVVTQMQVGFEDGCGINISTQNRLRFA